MFDIILYYIVLYYTISSYNYTIVYCIMLCYITLYITIIMFISYHYIVYIYISMTFHDHLWLGSVLWPALNEGQERQQEVARNIGQRRPFVWAVAWFHLRTLRGTSYDMIYTYYDILESTLYMKLYILI